MLALPKPQSRCAPPGSHSASPARRILARACGEGGDGELSDFTCCGDGMTSYFSTLLSRDGTISFAATVSLVFLVFISAVADSASEIAKKHPRFEDYPVKEVFKGSTKAVDLTSHPNAKKFRTLLREGSKGPP